MCLSACSKIGADKTPPTFPQSFETDLEIRFNESEITAHWVCETLASNKFEMISPNSINGLILEFMGSTCTVTYEGLSFAMDFARFPQTAFGTELINAFETVVTDTDITVTQCEDSWEYKGLNSSGSFILKQNNTTGFFEYFSVPSMDLTIVFKNFQKI